MRSKRRTLLVCLTIAVAATGCATSEQWADWRAHSSHFASGSHLWFSLRHQGDAPTPRVRQRDVEVARGESWWGEPVVVRPDQLFAGSR
jgi:hypothetical protein